jgi:anthranilate phosphoribosyltransferase
VREILFYRSLLHSCEVMANPGGATRSIVGAAHGSFLTRFLDVQVAQGLSHVLSVKGLDGGDELPLQPTAAVEHRDGKTEQLTLDPAEHGLAHAEPLACRHADETAQRIRAAFRGEDAAVRDALIWNGGVRLYVGGKVATIGDGVALARETLASGAALKHLERLQSGL